MRTSASYTIIEVYDGDQTFVKWGTSSSNTSVPASFGESEPTPQANVFIWRKEGHGLSIASATWGNPICMTGATGAKGIQGPQGLIGPQGGVGPVGQGIDSITEQYAISTSKTTPPAEGSTSWKNVAPTWSTGKYLWTRSKIVYKNPTDTKYTTAVCDNAWEAVNEISVGGRNLLLNSKYHDFSLPAFSGSTAVITSQNEYNTGTNFRLRVNIPTTVKDGEQFVFSFAFSRTYSSQTIYVSTPSKTYTFRSEVVSSGIYKRYSFVFTKSAEDSYVEIYTSSATANWTLNSKEYQIELGNQATDWTPAPEDLEGVVDLSVKSSDVEYYLSTSATSLSGGSWKTTAPTWVDGKYMWSRTRVELNNGTVRYTPSESGTCIAGAKGATGDKGDKGIQGIQGDRGEQGIKGTDGKTSYFHIKYSPVINPSSSQMSETPNTFIGTYVDYTATDSTNPSKYTWSQFKGSQGVKGDKGIAGINGTDGKTSYLHIAYSNSADGSQGFSTTDNANKLFIGQYTDFIQQDSTSYSKYSWTKIKGDKGDKGIQGIQGDKGEQGIKGTDGKTSYFHIKYSPVINPSSSQMTETPSTFIGTYVDYIQADSTNPLAYTWARFEGIQGDKGDKGIPGINGTDGKTSYLHIAYSNSSDGSQGFSTTDSVNKLYIGQYTDFVQQDSTSYSKYSWTKIKGEVGDKGDKGVKGDGGEPAKVFDLVSDKTTYIINLRALPSFTQKVGFSVITQNVSGSVVWSYPAGYTPSISGNNLSLTIPYNERNLSLAVKASIPNTSYSKTIILTGVVQEENPLYIGTSTANPTATEFAFIAGDFYLNTSINTGGTNTEDTLFPFRFDGTNWIKIDESNINSTPDIGTIFGSIQKDVGNFLIANNKATNPSIYVYFKRIIAEYINAETISAMNIKLQSSGKMESSEFFYDNQVNDGKATIPTGFRFSDNGEAYVTDLKAQNMYAKNSTIEGNFISKALETVDGVPHIDSSNGLINNWVMGTGNKFGISKQGTLNWFSIAYGEGKFVAVGANGQIGIYENNTWTVSTQGTKWWYGIAYGEGKFIAVGVNGQIGIYENNSWTISKPETSHWRGIAYGEGKFVAVGANGQIGIYENNTWTVSTQGTEWWYGIAYGEGKFIAVGANGQIGIYENNSWTVSTQGTEWWYGIAYGDNKFIAVGDGGQIGIYENNSWTISKPETSHWDSIAYGEGKFVAVGFDGQIGIYGNNSWTVSTQGTEWWRGIVYGDNKFVVVGVNGQIGITDLNFNTAIFYLSTLKNQGLVEAGTTTPLALKEEPFNLLKKCSGKFKLGTTLIGNISRMQVTPSQIYIEHSAGTYIMSFDGNSDIRYSIEDLVVLPTDESVEFNLLLPRTVNGKVQPAQIGRKGKEIEAGYFKDFTTSSLSLGSFSAGQNGYTYLPNGLLLQWGRANSVKFENIQISFNVPFIDNAYSVMATVDCQSEISCIQTGMYNKNNFTLWTDGAGLRFWMAIGI